MRSLHANVSFNFKILPFGHAMIEIKSGEGVEKEKVKQPATYMEPKTTDTKIVEIIFGGDNYIVPKTTGGLL
jgi:hypothetical protein